MAIQPHRNTGHRRRRGREAKRLARDRKIYAKMRHFVLEAERLHVQAAEPIEPLTVFYGKEALPQGLKTSPFPMVTQANGRPMPQWKDLSQWMKVTMATIVSHEWDLLTFNINLHPDLEADLVSAGMVRAALSERVRKQLSRTIGAGREYFFVVEGHSMATGQQTHLHIHGAIAVRDGDSVMDIRAALAKAAGHDLHGRSRMRRAVHTKWFNLFRVAYPDYLFKFRTRRDPRLDERRLVMSRSMTQAASMFWSDVAHERSWV
tara:strand:+ start:136 stop:921 length:786 start_codon:yes stop_codon:yes gene_type:complete